MYMYNIYQNDQHGNAHPTIAPGYVTAWARKYLLTGAIGLYWLYKRSALGRYAPSCLSLINPIQTSAPVSNYYFMMQTNMEVTGFSSESYTQCAVHEGRDRLGLGTRQTWAVHVIKKSAQ